MEHAPTDAVLAPLDLAEQYARSIELYRLDYGDQMLHNNNIIIIITNTTTTITLRFDLCDADRKGT